MTVVALVPAAFIQNAAESSRYEARNQQLKQNVLAKQPIALMECIDTCNGKLAELRVPAARWWMSLDDATREAHPLTTLSALQLLVKNEKEVSANTDMNWTQIAIALMRDAQFEKAFLAADQYQQRGARMDLRFFVGAEFVLTLSNADEAQKSAELEMCPISLRLPRHSLLTERDDALEACLSAYQLLRNESAPFAVLQKWSAQLKKSKYSNG